MKKTTLFIAILFSAVSMVMSQGNVPAIKGTASLTLNLNPVLSINVNGDVVIDYLTAEDYQNGKSSELQVTTVTVASQGAFVVRVQAEDLSSGTNTIAASSIKVSAEAVSSNDVAVFDSEGTLEMGEGKKPLIQSTVGGIGKTYKVTYKGAGANEYMENLNSEGSQSYTTTVVYTISAS